MPSQQAPTPDEINGECPFIQRMRFRIEDKWARFRGRRDRRRILALLSEFLALGPVSAVLEGNSSDADLSWAAFEVLCLYRKAEQLLFATASLLRIEPLTAGGLAREEASESPRILRQVDRFLTAVYEVGCYLWIRTSMETIKQLERCVPSPSPEAPAETACCAHDRGADMETVGSDGALLSEEAKRVLAGCMQFAFMGSYRNRISPALANELAEAYIARSLAVIEHCHGLYTSLSLLLEVDTAWLSRRGWPDNREDLRGLDRTALLGVALAHLRKLEGVCAWGHRPPAWDPNTSTPELWLEPFPSTGGLEQGLWYRRAWLPPVPKWYDLLGRARLRWYRYRYMRSERKRFSPRGFFRRILG